MANLLQSLASISSSSNPVTQTLVPVVTASFLTQSLFAIPSIALQTEQAYDFAGCVGFLSSVALSLYIPALRNKQPLSQAWRNWSTRQILMSGAVVFWSGRLGSFLVDRIRKDKKDSRFDEIKTSPAKFAGAWTGQAVWVIAAGLPVYLINAIPKSRQPPMGPRDFLGLGLWAGAFALEILADNEKSAWRKGRNEKKHDEKFISSGLWSWSRHPNYVGEVSLWAGLALASTRTLSYAAQAAPAASLITGGPLLPSWAVYTAAISPVFEYLLVRYASGVPLLEKSSDKRYGDDPKWIEYKKKVPIFFALPGGKV